MAKEGVDALILIPNPLVLAQQQLVVDLAARHKQPAMYWDAKAVEAGGLISYGVNYADQLRRAAGYVDRILRGAKPGEMPIEQPTRFELVINLKTAKALGLTIPQSLLLRADQVIQ